MNAIDKFLAANPAACKDAREWLVTQSSARDAWKNCERADWMLWAIRGNPAIVKRIGKVRFVAFAVACAERRLKMFESQSPTKAAADVAYAAYAAYATSAASATSAAASATSAASAAAYAAAYAAERKWQSDKLRKIIGRNPFASLDKG